MVNRIIEEIYVCLNSNCFLAALSTALTLPDICGKAEYGDIGTKKRYVQWFDVNIANFEKDKNHEEGMPYISGEIIYNLRNNTLHAGSYNIDGKELKIQNFELLVQNPNGAILTSYSEQITHYYKNGIQVQGDRSLCINVVDLILNICNAAKYYYEKNQEKFEFMNNKIVTIDRKRLKSWGIKDLALYEGSMSYSKFFTLEQDKIKIKWNDYPILLKDCTNNEKIKL